LKSLESRFEKAVQKKPFKPKGPSGSDLHMLGSFAPDSHLPTGNPFTGPAEGHGRGHFRPAPPWSHLPPGRSTGNGINRNHLLLRAHGPPHAHSLEGPPHFQGAKTLHGKAGADIKRLEGAPPADSSGSPFVGARRSRRPQAVLFPSYFICSLNREESAGYLDAGLKTRQSQGKAILPWAACKQGRGK